MSLCLTCTSCCHVAARFLYWHCRLPLCLRVSLCFTRMARAISATEPLMRVCVLHGQSKVMSSTRSEHDQPAQPPNKNTLQGNSSPTAQALLRTLTANHEPQCKAMNFAACRFSIPARRCSAVVWAIREVVHPRHTHDTFMPRNSQHSLWASDWLSVVPFLMMSLLH